MLKVIKVLTLGAAKRSRVFELVMNTGWRQRRLLILCYHSLSVDQEHQWRRALFFTLPEFETRLALLKQWRMNILPLGEAVTRLQDGSLPPRSAALTFDDGTADFWLQVWPTLKKHGYPATVYATTYYSEKRRPIFRLMCSYVLWKGRERVIRGRPDLGLSGSISLAGLAERRMVEDAIVDRAEHDGLSAEARDDQLAAIAAELGVDYEDLRRKRVLQLMTPEEMALAAVDGADVQLHTHRHRVPREQSSFNREILENRERLERATGRPAVHFCYPRGVNFPEFLPWLVGCGVTTATTTQPSLVTRGAEPLLLPRVVDTSALSPVEVEGWLCGVSQSLPRRRSE